MFGGWFPRVAVAAVGAATGVALLGGAAFAWSGQLRGRPAMFEAGGTSGYYVWQDDAGLHLRTTDSSGVSDYRGVLTTDGTFTDVAPMGLEADDRVRVFDGGKEVAWRFRTYEGIDGIDFRVHGGTYLSFRLDRDGTPIDPARIFLGEDSHHPAHDPFVVYRDDAT